MRKQFCIECPESFPEHLLNEDTVTQWLTTTKYLAGTKILVTDITDYEDDDVPAEELTKAAFDDELQELHDLVDSCRDHVEDYRRAKKLADFASKTNLRIMCSKCGGLLKQTCNGPVPSSEYDICVEPCGECAARANPPMVDMAKEESKTITQIRCSQCMGLIFETDGKLRPLQHFLYCKECATPPSHVGEGYRIVCNSCQSVLMVVDADEEICDKHIQPCAQCLKEYTDRMIQAAELFNKAWASVERK